MGNNRRKTRLKPRDWRSDSEPSSGVEQAGAKRRSKTKDSSGIPQYGTRAAKLSMKTVDDEMAVTEAPCSGNGSERVDRNGAATATASRLVTVLEPILEEYAVETRFLSKVKDEADLEVGCREASKELTLCIRVKGSRALFSMITLPSTTMSIRS